MQVLTLWKAKEMEGNADANEYVSVGRKDRSSDYMMSCV